MHKYLTLAVIFTLVAAFGVGNAEPVPVFDVIDGQVNGESMLARAEISGGYEAYCNDDHAIPMLVHASLAQWSRVILDATVMDWQILKPGDYAARLTTISLQSNGDVLFDFHDMGDLINEEGDIIPTQYALMPVGLEPGPNDWIPAELLNDPALWPYLDEDQEHNPIDVVIWIRLIPHECDSACEYVDRWVLTVDLLEQKDWVEQTPPI